MNPHAVALGRLGGKASKGKTSPAKARTARENAAKGRRVIEARRRALAEAKSARIYQESVDAYIEARRRGLKWSPPKATPEDAGIEARRRGLRSSKS